MKKHVFFFFLFCILSLSSCKKNKKDIVIIKEEDTLKKSVAIKESKIIWTETIDGEILEENISTSDIINNNLELNVYLIDSISNFHQNIFPQNKDIGSFDNTEISDELLQFIKDVCNQIKNNPQKNMEQYFDSEYLFNYVFFKNDLIENWKKLFNEKYPDQKPFKKYYIGKVTEGFDIDEVKVRFYNSNNYVDLKLFISQNEKKINLKQIEIDYSGR